MKKYKGILILLGVVAALLIPKFFCGEKKGEAVLSGGMAKVPIKVTVKVLEEENFSPVYQVSGTLVSNERVELKSETQGLVTKIGFIEGSHVKKGDLLVKLNDKEYQSLLKKAIANRKLKEDNRKRNEVLLKKEAISQADYDLSSTELSAIDADIELIQEQIRKTEIRAPFSGNIGLRAISLGTNLAPNTVVATLEDDSQLKLEFSVPEKYALLIGKGDQVSFRVSGSETVFQASIYARESSVSEQTRTVKMKAICANTDRALMPGLFANILIKPSTGRKSFLIPTQSLVPVLKGQKVFLVQGDSVVEQMVKTGFRDESRIEITEGLKAGDSLVVNGIMYMKKGVKVKVVKN